MAKDYVPGKDLAFDAWLIFLVNYVMAKTSGSPPPWTHIPLEALGTLVKLSSAWTAAFAVYKEPHTPVDTLAKQEARTAVVAYVRIFVNQYLRYPPVTDEDRRAMGIPNKDPKPSPVPPPPDIPDIVTETPHPRIVLIRFRALGAKRWGKPEGVHSIECVWMLCATATPPKTFSEFTHKTQSTSNPLAVVVDEADRGKHCYFAVHWLTSTLKEGPWSEIFHVVIP